MSILTFSSPIPQNPNFRTHNRRLFPQASIEFERGVEFDAGDSFFRHESSTARDLGVLAASIHRRSTSSLHILDAMCGCGVRSLRYLSQGSADYVWANDANEDTRRVITSNLQRSGERGGGNMKRRWVVTHMDARRLLGERFLEREYFDLVDVDSFGGDSSFLRSAIEGVRLGGLLYVTCTNWYSSSGQQPQQ